MWAALTALGWSTQTWQKQAKCIAGKHLWSPCPLCFCLGEIWGWNMRSPYWSWMTGPALNALHRPLSWYAISIPQKSLLADLLARKSLLQIGRVVTTLLDWRVYYKDKLSSKWFPHVTQQVETSQSNCMFSSYHGDILDDFYRKSLLKQLHIHQNIDLQLAMDHASPYAERFSISWARPIYSCTSSDSKSHVHHCI